MDDLAIVIKTVLDRDQLAKDIGDVGKAARQASPTVKIQTKTDSRPNDLLDQAMGMGGKEAKQPIPGTHELKTHDFTKPSAREAEYRKLKDFISSGLRSSGPTPGESSGGSQPKIPVLKEDTGSKGGGKEPARGLVSVGQQVGNVASKVTSGINAVTGSLAELGGSTGIIGSITTGLSGLVGAFGPVGIAIGGVAAAAVGFMAVIPSLAGAANPAALKMFTGAIEDTVAVVGRMFVPYLRLMTESLRFAADMLASFLPTTQEMTAVLAPLREAFAAMKAALSDLFNEIGPLIKGVFLGAMYAMSSVISFVAKTISLAIKIISFALSMNPLVMLAKAMMPASKFSEGSSMNAAGQKGNFVGNFEDIGKQAALAALTVGTAGMDPQVATAQNTAKIQDTLKEISGKMDGGSGTLQVNQTTSGVGDITSSGNTPKIDNILTSGGLNSPVIGNAFAATSRPNGDQSAILQNISAKLDQIIQAMETKPGFFGV